MKLHLDLDCFFVSAHRTIDKTLLNIPVAVGGRSNLEVFEKNKKTRHISESSGAFVSSIVTASQKSEEEYFLDGNGRLRGILTTASYEARKYGIKTAMNIREAKILCPQLRVIPPNYPLYHRLSQELKAILEKEIPIIEQFSIDEFFGDVSGWIEDDEVEEFAKYIKDLVMQKLGLPISIGISKSKWIAKLVTEFAKPDGVKYVKSSEVEEFIKDLDVKEFPGIGKGYQQRLQSNGILKLGDVKAKKDLFYTWGKSGKQLYHRILGTDEEPIKTRKDKKSIGVARTFDPILDREEMKRRISILCRHISFLVHKAKVNPLSYHLKIRYRYREKSKAFINTNRLFNEIYFKNEMIKLFEKIDNHPSHEIIQLYITVGSFQNNTKTTLNLFDYEEDNKKKVLTDSIQGLRGKFGLDIIKTGNEL